MTEKVAPYAAGTHEKPFLMASRACRTMREAVGLSVSACPETQGRLAIALDMQPSHLSGSISPSVGDPARYFPADKLVELCEASGNISPLLTLAAHLGYEVVRREELRAVAADLDRHARALRGER